MILCNTTVKEPQNGNVSKYGSNVKIEDLFDQNSLSGDKSKSDSFSSSEMYKDQNEIADALGHIIVINEKGFKCTSGFGSLSDGFVKMCR